LSFTAMPLVTLTSVPDAEALAALLLLAEVSAGSSAGGVEVLDGGAAVVDGGAAPGAVFEVWASAGAAVRLRIAAAAKARRLFIGMHAPRCAPPRPAPDNLLWPRRFRRRPAP
jgi:hypothetical protein